jgi:hypothetical protein
VKETNPTLSTPVSPKKAGFTHESTHAATVEWWTPKWLLDRIGIESYSMDVCSPGGHLTNIPADTHLTILEDGLATPWFGTVWCNPPYGKETATWMAKLADHGDGIALVFPRPDTKWFQAALAKATVVCFVAGRIPFIDGRLGQVKGSPGAGSALFAFGETAAQAVLQSGLGVCVRAALAD